VCNYALRRHKLPRLIINYGSTESCLRLNKLWQQKLSSSNWPGSKKNNNMQTFTEQVQHKIDNKTKPVGSLGMLESIALQAAQIQQTFTPVLNKPHIVVFAADHGIAATGLVNPYPQAVTAQMVLNFLNGGAAINVFCRQHAINLMVVDAGVKHHFNLPDAHNFINAKIADGTHNYLEEPAMSDANCLLAIEKGKEITQQIAATKCNIIGFGEMGIGNTSAASLIMHAFTQIPLQQCVGRGAGVTNEQLYIKLATLKQAAKKHLLHTSSLPVLQILQRIGGFEIAMMVGAFIKAAELKMIIMVDGFIATAALLVAQRLRAGILANCIFAHASSEQGHEKMLEYLQVKPLLQLGMRLGEGTGAALAIPLVQSAVNMLNHMASFETAGVSNKA
jgi:nicotinate-nucleotide--dimethylbenzimidazole phosphoribosyltransferase